LKCLRRGANIWPLNGIYKVVYEALQRESEMEYLVERIVYEIQRAGIPMSEEIAQISMETLEGLVTEGWVSASFDPAKPLLDVGKS
jgi:hypothetical protein